MKNNSKEELFERTPVPKAVASLVFAILRKVVLDRLFPMYGLAYAQLVAEFVLAIAAFVILERIMKQKT